MSRALPHCLGIALLLAATAPRAATDAPPRQLAYLGAGVPIPLELYGYDPNLDGSGFAVDLLLHGRLWYSISGAGWPLVSVGLRIGASGLRASDGALDVTGYLVSIGPELSLRLPFGGATRPDWGAGAGLGPTFVLSGFEIDEHLEERTTAWGLQGHLWLDRRVRGWLFVALDVGIEHAFDPIGAPTFFNAPLGSNTILCLTVGPLAVF